MPAGDRFLLPAVALISGAALGYELLLLRFFSLMYWSHFAHLIISMALLGFGVSGTILVLFQNRLIRTFHRSFFLSALLFVLTLLTATSLAGRLGFNPPEVIWDGGQLGRLAAVFSLVTLPFCCAGLCIGLTLRWQPRQVARIYRADLIGAACGALLIMALLFVLTPQKAVRVLALAGLAAAFLAGGGNDQGHWSRRFTLAGVALLIVFWPAQWLAPVISPFKGLSQILHIPGVRIAERTFSPAGDFTALTSETVPFRFAPGLSMLAPITPAEQVALFHDGHPAGMINQGSSEAEAMEFMRWTPMALPYVLLERPRVLILGAGGGGDVGHALLEEASQVDAVEPHRELSDFIRGRFHTFTGGIYDRDTVHLHHNDVRGFLAAARTLYDLIQISPFGTATPPAAGGQALDAQYLYTVEGMRLALSRLTARGILAVTLTLDLPPRSAVKMLDTIAEALMFEELKDPAQHVAVIRTWNTVTIAASPSPLSAEQQTAVRAFCRSRAFDLVWLPNIKESEVNRYNVLERPFIYEAAREIWRGDRYRQSHAFNIAPATDDRPWFSHFFRWRSFAGLWAQRDSGSASMLEWEYLLLWMSLAVALTVSLLLIALPLGPLYRTQHGQAGGTTGHAVRSAYFAALGLAFFFLEIAFIQKFVLFLHQPMIAMAVVVPSFLFFAGCGSGYAESLAERAACSRRAWLQDRPVALAAGAIVMVSAVYLWLLPLVFRLGAAWPDPLRITASILLIGGLAFWMGMPFPLGLKRLGNNRPDFLPYAWGVNGFFSVISSIAATILALHIGFRLVIVLALGLYLLAAACERRL
jgi:spermidine synthase